jgi:O-antigen/teichoic acid export membrane protein
VLAALVLWPSLIANLGDLGGPVAYVYQAAKRPNERARLVANAFAFTAIQSVLLAMVGIPLLFVLLQKYDGYLRLGIVLLVVLLPLNLLTRYLNAINQGSLQFKKFNIIRLLVQACYVLAVVALFVADRATVRTIVAAVILSNVIVLIAAIAQQRESFRELVFDRKLMRETFSYGLRAHIGNLTPVDSMQIDLAVVVAVLGPRDAGLYAIAISAAMIVRAQGTTFGMVAFPSVAAQDEEAGLQSAAAIFRASLLLNLATALAIGGGAWLLVPLVYGDAFSGATPILQVLVVGIVAASLRQVLGDCMRGLGKPIAATVGEVASWVVAVVGLITLVPLLGTVGAAVAVSASYVSALTVVIFFAQRAGLSIRSLFVLGRRDAKTLFALPRRTVDSRSVLVRPTT